MAILTKLSKEDFKNILKNYNIGVYKNHKHIPFAIGNTVHTLKTTKGKWILKIFEHADPNFIKYQIKLMNRAIKGKLPVSTNIKTKSGNELLIYNKNRIIIQKFVVGKNPKKISKDLIKRMAKMQAKLIKELMKIRLQGKYTWGKDYQFRYMEFNVKKYRNFNIRGEEKKILMELGKINRRKLRRSNIHADFHTVNLLVAKNKIKAILDWDDAHEDYIIYDLVASLTFDFVTERKIYKDKMMLYLKEFQKIIKLNNEEKKAMYYFFKYRYLQAIAWHIVQKQKHKDRKSDIDRRIRHMITLYKNFNNLSLEEFLEIIK